MKLPSIEIILQGTNQVLRRFPVVLINTVITVLAALVLIDYEGPAGSTILFKILFAGIIGIPFLLSIALFIEKMKLKGILAFAIQTGGILLLIIYGSSIPAALQSAPSIHLIRLIILLFSAHFLVAVLPFSGKNEINGFWQYNQILLTRLITSLLFTLILYTGLSIALAALHQLFGINIPGKRYFELFILLIGIFNTSYFLSGIPGELNELEEVNEYPRGLKIFTQYVLVPLLLVYLIILYAYIVKITFAWDLPQGWVSRLILGFSSIGLLSLLLLYPIRNSVGNKWMRIIWKKFFYVLIPLIILLPIAVERRVSQYGYTESRYIAYSLALWLFVIVLYFIITKKENIKFIPASLCILTFLMSYGPWNLFTVSESNQVERLKVILQHHSILVNGKVSREHPALSYRDAGQISSIITYLNEVHGYGKIQPWFDESLQKDSAGLGLVFVDAAFVTEKMGIKFVRIGRDEGLSTITYSSNPGVLDISGYEKIIPEQHIDSNRTKKNFDEVNISYSFVNNLNSMSLYVRDNQKKQDSINITFEDFFTKLVEEYEGTGVRNIPAERMSISIIGNHIKLKVYFRYIEFHQSDKKLIPTNYTVNILYSTNTPE